MEFQEFAGKSTEDAIEQACADFQVTAELLEIEILSVGSPGLFGLGGRKARIRAALREESEENLLTVAQEVPGEPPGQDAGEGHGQRSSRRRPHQPAH